MWKMEYNKIVCRIDELMSHNQIYDCIVDVK